MAAALWPLGQPVLPYCWGRDYAAATATTPQLRLLLLLCLLLLQKMKRHPGVAPRPKPSLHLRQILLRSPFR
jgi:hypothetical protein